MTTSRSNKRIDERMAVRWKAECRMGGLAVRGTIRDVSSGGVFFAADRDRMRQPRALDDNLLNDLEQDDRVLVRFTVMPFKNERQHVAVVRWMGRSDAHQCTGLGLQFDEG